MYVIMGLGRFRCIHLSRYSVENEPSCRFSFYIIVSELWNIYVICVSRAEDPPLVKGIVVNTVFLLLSVS